MNKQVSKRMIEDMFSKGKNEKTVLDMNKNVVELLDIVVAKNDDEKRAGVVARIQDGMIRVEWIGWNDYDHFFGSQIEVIGKSNPQPFGAPKFKRFDTAIHKNDVFAQDPREWLEVVILDGPTSTDYYKVAYMSDVRSHVEILSFMASEEDLLTEEEQHNIVEEYDHTVEGKEDDGEFVEPIDEGYYE